MGSRKVARSGIWPKSSCTTTANLLAVCLNPTADEAGAFLIACGGHYIETRSSGEICLHNNHHNNIQRVGTGQTGFRNRFVCSLTCSKCLYASEYSS